MTRHTVNLCLSLLLLQLCCALTLNAQNNEYRLMHQGNAQFRARNYDRAENYYIQALKLNPNSSRATFNLADVYLAKGNPHAADSLYDRVTKLERNGQVRAMAWHNRGYICQKAALQDQKEQQKLLRKAIGHYKQALRLNPHDEDTRYNLALCQAQLKKGQGGGQPEEKPDQQQGNENKPQQDQQQQQQQTQPNEQDRRQTEQYLNLARQAERRAREKLNAQQPRQKSLDKNW